MTYYGMLMTKTEQKAREVKFFSRISKSGKRFFISIPIDMHNEIAALRDMPLKVTLKEVPLD